MTENGHSIPRISYLLMVNNKTNAHNKKGNNR